jgi:hypothetical protein
MALKNFSLADTSFAGLECILGDGGDIHFNLILLRIAKGIIFTVDSRIDISDVSEIAKLVKNRPVILSVSGKGLIHRRVPRNDSDTVTSLLQKTLPNASAGEFYVQESSSFNGMAFVSIMRRTTLDKILDDLTASGMEIIRCNMGPFQVGLLLPVLEISRDYQYEFDFLQYRVSVIDSVLTGIQFNQQQKGPVKIPVSGEEIDANLLIAFASAFSGFLNVRENLLANMERVELLSKQYEDKKRFRFTGSLILSLFALLLALNFFISDHYKKKRDAFQSEVSINTNAVNEFDTLNKVFSEKQAFLKKNGLLSPSRLSYYADDLARDLPEMIQFTEMNINPVERRHPDDESMEVHTGQIAISGNCAKSIELNDWMRTLKKKSWVKTAILVNYSHDKNNTNGNFLISILTR